MSVNWRSAMPQMGEFRAKVDRMGEKTLMFRVCCILAVMLGFVIGATSAVRAELISANDAIFGVDSITQDTRTGLEWLDLTRSNGRSFNDVSTQFGPAGDFAGWRYASTSEVQGLFNSAGITGSRTAANFAPAVALTDLVGVTAFNPSNFRSLGRTGTFSSIPDNTFVSAIQVVNDGTAEARIFGTAFIGSQNIGQGSWLVRPLGAGVPSLTCDGYHPPFDVPISLNARARRPIPLRIQLFDMDGFVITDLDISAPPVVNVEFMGTVFGDVPPDDVELLPVGMANVGNIFGYDATTEQWIYNLGTRQFTAPGTYTVIAVAGDETYQIDTSQGCLQTFERLN